MLRKIGPTLNEQIKRPHYKQAGPPRTMGLRRTRLWMLLRERERERERERASSHAVPISQVPPDDLRMPLVASASVCSLLLFLAVTMSLACHPMDVYLPQPQTKKATTTVPATAMTWSRMTASDAFSRSKTISKALIVSRCDGSTRFPFNYDIISQVHHIVRHKAPCRKGPIKNRVSEERRRGITGRNYREIHRTMEARVGGGKIGRY